MRKIQFDGCAVPNPGNMGIGAVLIENDSIVTTISKKLPDKGTNNIAEYTALLTGILKALELGWKNISIEGDSKLVINQLNGTWTIKKEHLENLYNQIVKELSKFDSYTINWIPRENNSLADKLSCKALGYEEDPHKAFKKHFSYKKSADIKCPICKRDCKFNWQLFKNSTKHIRQDCPVHGYIRYSPNKEPYITLANQGDPDAKIIIIEKNMDRIVVFFPYDKDYITKIKSIPGYRFHKEIDKKYWSFPLSNYNLKKLESIFEKKKLDIDPSLKNYGGENMIKYQCTACSYIYDPEIGDPPRIKPGTPFENLPEEWVCPQCGVGKDMFARLE